MDMDKTLLRDLSDVTDLYERKLCSMGIVAIKLRLGVQASRVTSPDLASALVVLAEQAEAADERQVTWLEGMTLIDRMRALLSSPPVAAPVLALVSEIEVLPSNLADAAEEVDAIAPDIEADAATATETEQAGAEVEAVLARTKSGDGLRSL
jgi:hypothetical protein